MSSHRGGSASKRASVSIDAVREATKGKGLRQFSAKVCDKVQEKGVTSYNQVMPRHTLHRTRHVCVYDVFIGERSACC